jgi:hypothetical protein
MASTDIAAPPGGFQGKESDMADTILDQVWTLTIDHRHGTDTRVFRTEAAARTALAAFAREWWPRERGEDARYSDANFAALDDAEAIDEYFREVGDEWFVIDPATVEG